MSDDLFSIEDMGLLRLIAPDVARKLTRLRARIEAADKVAEALAWVMKHRSFCDIPSTEGEWDERATAALDEWDAALSAYEESQNG